MPGNHGTAAWVYTSTFGGGLVDGDRIRLDVSVGAGAGCLISSQGENRVYRSPSGCSHELQAEVEDGALLAIVPDPSVCFAGARYHQRIDIGLAPTASLIFADVLGCGRTARGERWEFSRFSAELKLRLGRRLIIDERVLLDPAHGKVGQRFGRFDAFASLLLVGRSLHEIRAQIRQRVDALPAAAGRPQLQSASTLGEDTLLIRMAAESVEDAVREIRSHLSFLPALLGDNPWARRN
jgi:urease accessory protein